jgi:ABC-type Fe3+/spermidine/putrescine transport system ATPase subunit
MTFALSIRGLRHAYGSAEILHGLDLDVPAGSILAVLGPSGCGKSTLLRLVAGFERPAAGKINIAGVTMIGEGSWRPPQRRPIGYVAQEGSLFPHLSVRRNLEFGLDRRQRGDRQRVAELLDLVSLDASCLERYPHELSGGQQQRVALARTLARRPALVLLDEPFAALDADLRAATRTAMAEVLRSAEVATVLVTYDQGEALSFADELAVMIAGCFTQVGPTRDVYECPADLETARLVGRAHWSYRERCWMGMRKLRSGRFSCACRRLAVLLKSCCVRSSSTFGLRRTAPPSSNACTTSVTIACSTWSGPLPVYGFRPGCPAIWIARLANGSRLSSTVPPLPFRLQRREITQSTTRER